MRALADGDAHGLHAGLERLGYLPDPGAVDRDVLLEHLARAGEWMLAPGFRRIDPAYVSRDPRARLSAALAALPADAPHDDPAARRSLLRRMEVQLLSLLGEFRAGADWGAIAAEHHSGGPASTALGRAEHAFWERRPTGRSGRRAEPARRLQGRLAGDREHPPRLASATSPPSPARRRASGRRTAATRRRRRRPSVTSARRTSSRRPSRRTLAAASRADHRRLASRSRSAPARCATSACSRGVSHSRTNAGLRGSTSSRSHPTAARRRGDGGHGAAGAVAERDRDGRRGAVEPRLGGAVRPRPGSRSAPGSAPSWAATAAFAVQRPAASPSRRLAIAQPGEHGALAGAEPVVVRAGRQRCSA